MVATLKVLTSLAVLNAAHAQESKVKCTPNSTTIRMHWNIYASRTGLYEVEGCDGVSPTLQLQAGVEYTFDQSDLSNWYHPIGFAYEPGGALNSCGDLEECPEVEEGLQYYIDGVAMTGDESGFGLDAYEPIFFYPREAWAERCGTQGCSAKLTLTADHKTVFYFCHIHKGMSAEIEVVNAAANASDPQFINLLQPVPDRSVFDVECGTWDTEPFSQSHPTCASKTFLCGDTSSAFDTCLDAIDCQMHHEMAVNAGDNLLATFNRQMIPHHENAVQMAKLLLKYMTEEDAGGPDEFAEFEALATDVVNTQNAQITTMEAWLKAYEERSNTETELCYTHQNGPCVDGGGKRRHLLFSTVPC